MLVHPGGWITLYAHHAVNRVVVGERVNAGTLIGQLGSTGISRGPHVHFELMYRGRNCDPMPLFQSYRHGTDSRLVQGPSVLWTDANERPRGVRCDARRKHPTYHH